MASVKIDSGEFPLIRNVDHTRQPECMKVYSEWIRIFHDDVPEAMAHLDDVLDDVIKFQLWTQVCQGGPRAMFERMGLFDLDLDAAKRALKRLKDPRLNREMRRVRSKELRAEGKSTREIAAELGVTHTTVQRDVEQKQSLDTENVPPPRQRTQVNLSNYTKPETAAGKLLAKFGHEWCQSLYHALAEALNG